MKIQKNSSMINISNNPSLAGLNSYVSPQIQIPSAQNP